jgi:hypothetical protein
MTNRTAECVAIMKKLRDELHIPSDDSGLKELSRRMTAYIKYGSVWAGYIAIPTLKRHLHVILPNNPAMEIRVVIKAVNSE